MDYSLLFAIIPWKLRTGDREGGLELMEALEAIRKRRSIRQYTGDLIPRGDLEKIVDAGRLAATGGNRQPWDFIVVTDREMIHQLKRTAEWMEKAGAIIAVVMDPSSRWWVEDGSAAIENMLIASVALGYGACWLEGTTLPMEEELKKLLHVPKDKRLLTLIPIGVPAESPTVEKKPLGNILHWEKY
jgi:nitroreductase